LAFDLSQLIMQACSFGVRLFSFGSVLDSANTAHRVEDFGHGSALAAADMFELVGVIVLVEGMSLSSVNATLKIPDFRPVLSLRDGSIADRDGGVLPLSAVVLQIVGENLEIIFAPSHFPDRQPNHTKSKPWHCRS
jgi:hypothetical protein